MKCTNHKCTAVAIEDAGLFKTNDGKMAVMCPGCFMVQEYDGVKCPPPEFKTTTSPSPEVLAEQRKLCNPVTPTTWPCATAGCTGHTDSVLGTVCAACRAGGPYPAVRENDPPIYIQQVGRAKWKPAVEQEAKQEAQEVAGKPSTDPKPHYITSDCINRECTQCDEEDGK